VANLLIADRRSLTDMQTVSVIHQAGHRPQHGGGAALDGGQHQRAMTIAEIAAYAKV